MQKKTDKLIIRPVRLKDSGAISKIINSIVAERNLTTFSETSEEEERRYIRSLVKNENIFVAEFDGKVVGFQTIGQFPDTTDANRHVGTMGTFLQKDYRKRGFGTELAKETFRWARRNGFEKLVIWVFEDNVQGLKFYEKLGFKPVGKWTKQVKIENEYHNEIVLEKFLDELTG